MEWSLRPPAQELNSMKMDLIQPFINAADAVLSQGLHGSTKIGTLSMEEHAYRRKGVAGLIALTGEIEGRVILDLEPQTAVRVASHYAGTDLPESDSLIKETVFELANQVVGNAISALNDQGFRFRVHPPLLLTSEEDERSSEDVEALMICFETAMGNVFMNVALKHNRQRLSEHAKAAGA
jgi:chemotaxis protein CheX